MKKKPLDGGTVRYLHYMKNWTFQQIGDIFGLSRQRVHQISKSYTKPEKTLKTLKNCLICKKAFSRKHAQKYCSKKCARIAEEERRIQKSQGWKVFNRDNFTCQYCGKNPTDDKVKLHIDHIKPKSKGGSERLSNLVTACNQCNLEKNDLKIKKLMKFQQRIRDKDKNKINKGGK